MVQGLKKKFGPDYLLIFLFITLTIFGLVVLTSASAPVAYGNFGDKYYFVKRQIFFGLIPGFILCLILSKLPIDLLKRLGSIIYLFSIFLLVLVYVPGIGTTFGTGSKSWLNIGDFSFQPAEFIKFGFILFYATLVDRHIRNVSNFFSGFVPALLFGLIPVVMILLQPDVGTASVLLTVVIILLYISGARILHLGVLFLVSIIILSFLIVSTPYRVNRFVSFMNPELDPSGIGYQVNQAELAIGSGGLVGLGYGHSRQKFEYLPEVHGDSIFAIIGEELGFIVSIVVIFVYTTITLRAIRITKRLDDMYSRLVMMGIVSWFSVQAFLNIGGIIGALPLTGVPLPFISHGGTSLLVSLMGVGVLINVSRNRIR